MDQVNSSFLLPHKKYPVKYLWYPVHDRLYPEQQGFGVFFRGEGGGGQCYNNDDTRLFMTKTRPLKDIRGRSHFNFFSLPSSFSKNPSQFLDIKV